MNHQDGVSRPVRSLSARMSGALGLLLAVGLFLAVPASASYEQVATFGGEVVPNEQSLQQTQFAKTNGMAVNVSGAGSVTPGTVYVARPGFQVLVKGEQHFHYGIPTYSAKGEFLGEFGNVSQAQGVAVNQATGNIYVLSYPGSNQKDVVKIYSPDGKLITSFGETGAFQETVDEGPEKIHWPQPSGIAVDDSGVVYVSDREGRVMVFEPESPGDYEHYVYAGRANDIAVNYYPQALALDAAGNLYIANEEAIYEFAPGEPDAPACEILVTTGGVVGMTVNPVSGEVFYFSEKNKKIHQLAPCNGQGEFVETSAFTPLPKTEVIYGLAFNPALAWQASRPLGILYAADAKAQESAHADVFAPAEINPPSVESESVSAVTSSTATLGAQINPKGSETRYAFQYITEAAYEANEPADRFAGATEAPLGGAVLGSGQSALSAGVALVGLLPDTAYRYRAVATSHCDPEKEEDLCEGTGPAQAFHTFAVEVPGLPDHRAWELVSPAQKSSGEVIPAYPSFGSCARECKPAAFSGAGGFPMQSAPDGDAVVYEGFPFSTSEGAAIFNEYIARRTASGWQTTTLSPLLQSPLLPSGYKAFDAELTQGVLYQQSPTLSSEALSEYANLYAQPTASPFSLTPLLGSEPPNRTAGAGSSSNLNLTYAGASADLSRIFFEANDALTGETPFAPEAVDGGKEKNNLYEWANGQLQLVNVAPGNTETAPGAAFGVPKSGYPAAVLSHVISADGSRAFWSDEAGQVYVRENGESTTEIPDAGKFLSASADGSEVLLSNGHIYDLETEETTDLSEGKGGFQGIAGQSEDLSRIYFVDTAVLDEGENDHGAKAQAGKYNLYAWDEGATTFIATLLPEDNPGGVNARGDWLASPAQRTAEASPDGRWVAFLSRAPLTGYDNTGPCGGVKGGPCPEVLVYDSASGSLICASCNPSGTRPLGTSNLRLIQSAEGSNPQPRYLTNEGRLYFDTQDSLTPFDTNSGVEDVYQYEPEGVGTCKREGGCVQLISAGHEPVDSNLLAVDETGKNVFFTTRDQLVLKDRDDLIDLYVAREDGGIPAETEAVKPSCQGEACVPALSPPNDPTPGSSSFEGAGNVDEKKQAKKHKKKHKHAKKKAHRKQGAHKRGANHNRGGAR
jgi:hypothetical protein